MNAKQEAKLTMYRGVEQHLNTNSDIISTVAALVTAFNAFKAAIANIVNTTQLASVNLAGITVDKGNSKQNLARATADTAAIISAYASATGNPTLKAEVNYSYSKLIRLRDEMLAPICRIIHTRGTENSGAIKNYGITAEKLDELNTAIENYTAKTPNPRAAVSNRKTQNANLIELFRQADALLKNQIDPLMRNFRATNSDFYNTYQSAREIIDPSTTVTQLKGMIVDAADDKPVKGATVTIVQLGKTAVTNSAGEYSFKPVEHGSFTINAAATGYQTFEKDEFEIKMGEIKYLDVNLLKLS